MRTALCISKYFYLIIKFIENFNAKFNLYKNVVSAYI